jgi:hypothetical protein
MLFILFDPFHQLSTYLKVFHIKTESRLIVMVGPLLCNLVKQKEHSILIVSLSKLMFSYKHTVFITHGISDIQNTT